MMYAAAAFPKFSRVAVQPPVEPIDEKQIKMVRGGAIVRAYVPKGRFDFCFDINFETGVMVRFDYESGELRYHGPRRRRSFESRHIQTLSCITDGRKGCVELAAYRRAVRSQIAEFIEAQDTSHRHAIDVEYDAHDRLTVRVLPHIKAEVPHVMRRQIVEMDLCRRLEQPDGDLRGLRRGEKKAGSPVGVTDNDSNFVTYHIEGRRCSLSEFIDHCLSLSDGFCPSLPSETKAGEASSLTRDGDV